MLLRMSSRLIEDVIILDLSGRIVLGEESQMLRNFIEKIVAEGSRKIVLNIADVNYIDSTGVFILVNAFTTAQKRGGQVKLVSPTKKMQDLLQVTKLVTLFDVYSDERKAVESFNHSELHCRCPLCGSPSGPPVLTGRWIHWPPQACRNARCEATFTVASSQNQGQTLVKSVRIQTYKDEYFELLSGPPFAVKILGRLDIFSSPALKKLWQVLPLPRRVVFDLSGATEVDDAGRDALLALVRSREKDARVMISLEGLGSSEVEMFPDELPFYQDKATALSALGDVSDAPPLHARVSSE